MAFAMVEVATCILLLIILFANPLMCLCRCPPQEYEALLSLNITIAVEDDESSSIWKGIDIPWANGTDCCEWQGVECDQHNHHVVEINVTTVPYHHSLIGGVISNSLCELPLLTTIHLSNLGITGTLPSCLGNLRYLEELTMDDNMLGGVIPLSICTLTNLKLLRLRGNQLSGNLPFCLNNLSSLSTLDLSGNELSGQIPFTWGDLPLLQVLDVSFNQLSGTLPLSFAGLSSLTTLYANGNKFNESTPSWALPSSIQNLRLSLNELTISENFFHNLTKLEDLSLSNCTLNISISWIPNFQLVILELVSCQMDGQIPPWISTQFSLVFLTLANNGLGGEIPTWLWDMPSLSYLSLSRNHLHGPIFPNGPTSKIRFLDVSSNALSGSIPSGWPSGGLLPILILNDNLFTGNIPPSLCYSPGIPVLKLNLENNKFVGSIPWCLIEDDSSPFIEVNLGGNSFEGTMPQGLTVSHAITSLVLRNNQLSGSFLPSFLSDSNLQELDIGHNNFTGHLPKSIVNIPSIEVLVMRDNQFSGNILPEIGELKKLQILDLSSNNLSGPIPHNIVFLQAMTVAREDGYVQAASSPGSVFLMDFYLGELKMTAKDTELMKFALAGLIMTTKGTQLYYPYILSTLTSIDLSNNQLSGDVPLDFGMLKGLRFLNLSMNNLSGIIPQSLGDMSQLESLDLSSNKLCGNIPSELQSLSSLAYLNLSNNNLSGSIPQSGQMITFENTSYFKNPYLHGCPLANNCSWPKFTPPSPVRAAQVKDDQKSEQFPWYQIGVGWSYGAGFLIVVVLLLSVRESWRERYFKGVDNVLNSLFPFLGNRHL